MLNEENRGLKYEVFTFNTGKLIIISLALLIIPSLIIGIVSYGKAKNGMEDIGEQVLYNSVESALQLIELANESVEKGNIPLEVAQERVREAFLGPKDSEGKRPINYPGDLGNMAIFMCWMIREH